MSECCYTALMTQEKITRLALSAAIIIVLNLFFLYAINVFYPEAKYEAYCPREQVTVIPETEEECVVEGGAWTEGPNQKLMRPLPHIESLPEVSYGYCDLSYTCAKDYENARALYQRNVFVARVVLGVLSLLVGFYLTAYAPVSLGFLLGGILSLIIGTIGYWSEMQDYLRVVVLGVALAVLIWLGIKKFSS